jgi:hypothetical protein
MVTVTVDARRWHMGVDPIVDDDNPCTRIVNHGPQTCEASVRLRASLYAGKIILSPKLDSDFCRRTAVMAGALSRPASAR